MNVHRAPSLVAAILALGSQVIRAQLPPPVAIQPHESLLQAVTIHGNIAENDVPGAPFSAIEKSTYSKKQPDGTYEEVSSNTVRIYRDSWGRTRAEASFGNSEGRPPNVSITIVDPVSDSLYRLNPEDSSATRRSWKAFRKEEGIAAGSECFAETPEPQLPVVTEPLGSRTLEGLAVQGTRQRLAVPANAIENTRPFDIVVETWVLQYYRSLS